MRYFKAKQFLFDEWNRLDPGKDHTQQIDTLSNAYLDIIQKILTCKILCRVKLSSVKTDDSVWGAKFELTAILKRTKLTRSLSRSDFFELITRKLKGHTVEDFEHLPLGQYHVVIDHKLIGSGGDIDLEVYFK